MAKNKRCPLQEECEKKCSYQGHELDCDYYHVNARKDYYMNQYLDCLTNEAQANKTE